MLALFRVKAAFAPSAHPIAGRSHPVCFSICMAPIPWTQAGSRQTVLVICGSLCTSASSNGAACACRFMLGLHTLKFRDNALENLFRSHWDFSSRTLLTLLSVVTLGIWAVATWNVHSHCSWSRFLCCFLEALCGLVILTHVYIQYQLRMFPGICPSTLLHS